MLCTGGMGGRIVVHGTVAGVSLLLNCDDKEKDLAAVKVKG